MQRSRARAGGFTLIEMVTTLVILGILLALSVFWWSDFVKSSAQNRASAVMDRVVTLEQPIARDWGGYTSWPADLSDLGSDVTILNGQPSKNVNQVSVVVGSGGTLALAVRAGDGTCMFRLVNSLETGGGSSVPSGIVSRAACTAQSALSAEDPLVQTATIKSQVS